MIEKWEQKTWTVQSSHTENIDKDTGSTGPGRDYS